MRARRRRPRRHKRRVATFRPRAGHRTGVAGNTVAGFIRVARALAVENLACRLGFRRTQRARVSPQSRQGAVSGYRIGATICRAPARTPACRTWRARRGTDHDASDRLAAQCLSASARRQFAAGGAAIPSRECGVVRHVRHSSARRSCVQPHRPRRRGACGDRQRRVPASVSAR